MVLRFLTIATCLIAFTISLAGKPATASETTMLRFEPTANIQDYIHTSGAAPDSVVSGPVPPISELTGCAGASGPCDAACSCRLLDSCYRSCSPFYGYAEAVYLDRNNSAADQILVIDENQTPDQIVPLLRVSDNDYDFQPGVRAVLGWHQGPCHCCNSWEVGYLGIFNWNGQSVVTGDNNLGVFGPLGQVVNNFTGADRVVVDYDSQLHSGEFNCVHCFPHCSSRVELLMGFRYISLDETFDLESTDLMTSSTRYHIGTSNDLYGGQLGVRWRSWRWGRLETEAVAKAGIYLNDSKQSQFITPDFPPNGFAAMRSPRSTSSNDVAFAGELNFNLIYPVNDRWAIRGGYNLLWIEGVALGSDQLDFTANLNSGTSLDNNGGLFAHGVSLGVERRW